MESAQYKVQVLDRTCDILDCLADRGPELGVSEITFDLGLSKSTVHRLLSALVHRDLVQRVAITGKYRLGAKLVELGRKAVDPDRLSAAAGPYLTRLVAGTGETAHLGVLRNGEVVSVCAVESPKTLRTPSTVGKRAHPHSSSLGKCLLAELPVGELTLVLSSMGLPRFTEHTICTERELMEELATVRKQGYAVDDQEFELGLKCLGAPVRGESGRVEAAIGIAGSATRLSEDVLAASASAVMRVAEELSAERGFKGNRSVRSD